MTASYTDTAVQNHTAVFSWGDGSPNTTVAAAGPANSGNITASHTYAATGVYTVTVTVTDDCGATSAAFAYQFIVVYDPNGGFVTGGSRCTSEPLLTMDEQVRTAGDIAKAVNVPVVADGGAGFGEPLHTMRSVKEFIRAGVAGIHIEDQLYPKRAHYHKYVAHAIPKEEFIDKIKKNQELRTFQFDMAAPRILPNNHAQFRLEGKPK